jgi:hypothetical protein
MGREDASSHLEGLCCFHSGRGDLACLEQFHKACDAARLTHGVLVRRRVLAQVADRADHIRHRLPARTRLKELHQQPASERAHGGGTAREGGAVVSTAGQHTRAVGMGEQRRGEQRHGAGWAPAAAARRRVGARSSGTAQGGRPERRGGRPTRRGGRPTRRGGRPTRRRGKLKRGLVRGERTAHRPLRGSRPGWTGCYTRDSTARRR